MPEQRLLTDKMGTLEKRKLSDTMSRVLRRYAAKVKLTRKHFPPDAPYTEKIVVSGKVYTMGVWTGEDQMIVYAIFDPATAPKDKLLLPVKPKLIRPY